MRRRELKPKAKTALELAVDQELNDMFDRLGAGPRAEAAQRARIVELIELDRELDEGEQAEFDKFVARRDKDRRRSQRFAAAVDRRQLKHPDEDREKSWLAIAVKQGEKRRLRDERHFERQEATEIARQQECDETAAETTPAAQSAPSTYLEPEPVETPMLDAEPHRRRPTYGIVAQYDRYGDRVD